MANCVLPRRYLSRRPIPHLLHFFLRLCLQITPQRWLSCVYHSDCCVVSNGFFWRELFYAGAYVCEKNCGSCRMNRRACCWSARSAHFLNPRYTHLYNRFRPFPSDYLISNFSLRDWLWGGHDIFGSDAPPPKVEGTTKNRSWILTKRSFPFNFEIRDQSQEIHSSLRFASAEARPLNTISYPSQINFVQN